MSSHNCHAKSCRSLRHVLISALSDVQLCPALQEAFGPLDCDTPKTSFTTLPNDRFSHSTTYQYFAPLESLVPLITYAHGTLCPPPSSIHPEGASCASRVDRLSTASSLDVSYDTISHALKVTATWAHQPQPLIVASPLDAANHRVEVGVLAASDEQQGVEAHEIGMAGVLTVLGQDRKPGATMFKFPARHRQVENSSSGGFSMAVVEPAGLHPTVRITLDEAAVRVPSVDGECGLHAYWTLPRTIFADKYQLSDPLFLASKNLTALRYISQPVDLEAPDYVMKSWGSAALLELSPAPASAATGSPPGTWTAELPLHLRYLSPAPGGYRTVEVPYPAVFWACTTEEGTKFPSSPFERVNLGYDGLFGPRTVFWHIDPRPVKEGGRLTSEIRVPVLDTDKAGWVSTGTAAVVMLGFGWIVWKLLQVYLRTGYGPTKQMEGLEKKKKEQ